MRTLGVIPARGGSKGIPDKNLREVAGRSLVAWSIRCAEDSRSLDRWIVSTDDEEIASEAKSHGADVVDRPAELAADDAPMPPVVLHAVDEAEQRWDGFDAVVLLQPTSPQRTSDDVDECVDLLREGASSVVTVYRVEDAHPARMYRIEDERLVPLRPELKDRRRQDLPPIYHTNGAVYACTIELLRAEETLTGPDVRPYVMPRERSIDIDDPMDLRIANCLMTKEQD